MAEVREVPILFQGQQLPGVMGQVQLVDERWILTFEHLLRDEHIREAIRNIVGEFRGGQSVKAGNITGNYIEYELYIVPNQYNVINREAGDEGRNHWEGNAGNVNENENVNENVNMNNISGNRNRNYRGGKRKQKSRKPSKKSKKSKKTKRR